MNLHIVPDNTFINGFYNNLRELGVLEQNRIIVRTNHNRLLAVKHDLAFAPLYSSKFASFVGDTLQYDKVFIHYFTPLLYRWIARHHFKELNWMIWGGDLYNLAGIDSICYEPLTLNEYILRDKSAKTWLYRFKVWAFQSYFKKQAYRKVKSILTWMKEEYEFTLNHLPVHADHKFFFYENQFPYGKLDALTRSPKKKGRWLLMIGNSGSPANNHLDVIWFLESRKVQADLVIPVSYGDERYVTFLKKNLKYSFGKLEFVDRYMPFEEYVQFLNSIDVLIMNTIRPQGYGNILMMMYMDKPVFFNERNISLPDLTKADLKWNSLLDLPEMLNKDMTTENRGQIASFLSHQKLLSIYKGLFSE